MSITEAEQQELTKFGDFFGWSAEDTMGQYEISGRESVREFCVETLNNMVDEWTHEGKVKNRMSEAFLSEGESNFRVVMKRVKAAAAWLGITMDNLPIEEQASN